MSELGRAEVVDGASEIGVVEDVEKIRSGLKGKPLVEFELPAQRQVDIRGVESAGVLGTLLDRKLITTAGRKQVIGRPMQYKTSKDFLLRFGLNDINELPSMEEFSQLASDVTAIELTPETRSATPTLFELDQEAAEEAAATEQNPAEEPTKQEPAEESATADSQPAPVEQAAETALPENTETPSAAATGTDEPDQALPEDESAQAAERFGQK